MTMLAFAVTSIGFAAAANWRGVPEYEHPSIPVGGNRAATIELVRGRHQVFLR